MSEPAVVFEQIQMGDGYIGHATLNVEKTLNSLSLAMCELLTAQLSLWQNDSQCTVILLDGQGNKAFCAGGDVVQVYESIVRDTQASTDQPDPINTYATKFFATEYRLDYLIHTFTKPIICWANGYVMGGGIGLLSGASHRVVTQNSRLSMPEIKIGLYPDVGGTYFLNRTPGKLGLFLGLTAYQMNAADAVFSGLADRYLNHEDKNTVVQHLMSLDWRNIDDKFGAVSKVLRNLERQAHQSMTPSPLQQHLQLINELMDGDNLSEISANLFGSHSEEQWLKKAREVLTAGCPMTAHLVYQQLKRGKRLSLSQAFEMELTMSIRCCQHNDFPEGVRALLVEKDSKPQWQHKSVRDVSNAEVDAHFLPLWPPEKSPLNDLS